MTAVRRIVLWVLSTLSVLVLLFGYRTSTAGPTTADAGPAVFSGAVAGVALTPGASPSTATPSTPATSPTSSTSSTVTGETAQTQWGPVQVQLSVESGSITDVQVLQYPNGNPRDVEINSYALPTLVQETLDAQSAQIDMVSGATVTSVGYLQSLQSALDQVTA